MTAEEKLRELYKLEESLVVWNGHSRCRFGDAGWEHIDTLRPSEIDLIANLVVERLMSRLYGGATKAVE